MDDMDDGLTLDAKDDQHAPIFTGIRLDQLKGSWMAQSIKARRCFESVDSLKSIALIGAVRDHRNGKLNRRDEVACRAIMQALIPHVPLAMDCSVDFYNLSEGTDIFTVDKQYDLAIFCNLRELVPSLQSHYSHLLANGGITGVLNRKRRPIASYGHNLDRALADALRPSDILSGFRLRDIAPEHTYYVTVSEQAMHFQAYTNLLTKLKPRFVASWGFVQFIDGRYYAQPSTYDISRSPGQRLLNRESFTLTQQSNCRIQLIEPYLKVAKECMPHPPHIDFAVRNDTLESIALTDRHKAKASPLFAKGIETFEKLEILARIKDDRGRAPISRSEQVEWKSLVDLRAKLARPLSIFERTEKILRQAI